MTRVCPIVVGADCWALKQRIEQRPKIKQELWGFLNFFHSTKTPLKSPYARIVCSRVAVPMRPVYHRAVTVRHQYALRKCWACQICATTTKVVMSVHAPPIVDTHMLTKPGAGQNCPSADKDVNPLRPAIVPLLLATAPRLTWLFLSRILCVNTSSRFCQTFARKAGQRAFVD